MTKSPRGPHTALVILCSLQGSDRYGWLSSAEREADLKLQHRHARLIIFRHLHAEICTDLLWIPQVKEVQVALVTHLLVCGEHDDVAAEIEAARSDS